MFISSKTDIGMKRSENQDRVYTQFLGENVSVAIVCDGMGGASSGGVASQLAIDSIVKRVKENFRDGMSENSIRNMMLTSVHYANTVVYENSKADIEKNGMGTTVVAATLDGDTLCVANVGDSRLYIVGNREIRQITRDHSLVEEMVRMGGLKREQAKNHPEKNIITRAIGAEDEVDIDFFSVVLKPGDIVLMCTDGLTNMIEDEEIRMILHGQRDLVEKAESLVNAANNNGGKDNIAVVLIEPEIRS